MAEKLRNILVIEDNQDVLNGIVNILEYCGYPSEGVTRFNDSTFEKVKTDNFGLIILDVMLSGNDGRDLAKKFKSTKETSGVPILMISAYPNVESSAKKAGADDFLAKPFGLDELKQKVEKYF